VSPADDTRPVRRKILVVDDAPMFRELESMFLARVGQVVVAADGVEALAAARAERPDVVVADLTMPGMSGAVLCREIKGDPDLARTPVILVTGEGAGEDHALAVRSGADDIITKPVSRLALIQAVNRFLKLAVRGLVRVELETDVRIGIGSRDTWGISRNLSRGGMFVESQATIEPDTEIELEFGLPGGDDSLVPTAKVVWRRVDMAPAQPGMGLQFLKLDRTAADQIDAFVYEHANSDGPGRPGAVTPVR
jgi:uncharacterized protein (TIGR02266 family)